MAYTLVALALILLRYQPTPQTEDASKMDKGSYMFRMKFIDGSTGGRIKEGIPIVSNVFANAKQGKVINVCIFFIIFSLFVMGEGISLKNHGKSVQVSPSLLGSSRRIRTSDTL